jgi:hypothetical protein
MAQGLTGLALLSDVAGRELVFEWSNFGEWERLAVPHQVMGESMAELLVDQAGVWHIFWRERDTDEVWMISSVH